MENNEEVIEKAAEDQVITSAFSDVKMIDPDKPADAPVTQSEEKDDPKPDPRIQELEGELGTWKAKVEALESRQPEKEVVYQLPEDYVSIMEDPANRRLLDTDPESMSDLDLYKQVLREEKPWLKSNAALENEIRKQYPEADFDIPANLGLSDEDGWGEIKFRADGKRASISQQKSELQTKIDTAKQSALQARAQEQPDKPDETAIQKFLDEEFSSGLAARVIPQVDIPLEGFQFPSVSDAEMQEMFNSGNAIFKVDDKKGFVPDVQSMHDILLHKKTLEALKPMVEAAKRIAPKEAREALESSIANKTIPNKDTGGMRSEDPNAKQTWQSPYSDVRNIQN